MDSLQCIFFSFFRKVKQYHMAASSQKKERCLPFYRKSQKRQNRAVESGYQNVPVDFT